MRKTSAAESFPEFIRKFAFRVEYVVKPVRPHREVNMS